MSSERAARRTHAARRAARDGNRAAADAVARRRRVQGRLEKHGALLRNYTCANPPALKATLAALGRRIVPMNAAEDTYVGAALQLLVSAYAIALAPLGWIAGTSPGEEVAPAWRRRVAAVESELTAIVEGRASIEAWRQRCSVPGIGPVAFAAGDGKSASVVRG